MVGKLSCRLGVAQVLSFLGEVTQIPFLFWEPPCNQSGHTALVQGQLWSCPRRWPGSVAFQYSPCCC